MAEKPPSTDNSTPFTKLESCEARKSATVAISSGRPIFPRGIRDSNIRFASSVRTWSCIGAAIGAPGPARSPGSSCPSVRLATCVRRSATGITDGRTFPIRTLKRVGDAAAELSIELHNQYLLAYRPNNLAYDGMWHNLT